MVSTVSHSKPNPFVGSYTFPGSAGEPMSGVYLSILPNATYTVAYFGGIDVGTWSINPETGNLEMLHVNNRYENFYVYGRKNTSLANGTIRLEFDGKSPKTLVSFDNQKGAAPQMRPIFNQNFNCAKYPDSYSVIVSSRDVVKVHVAIPMGELNNEMPQETVQPIDIVDYSFDTTGQYNDYVIDYNDQTEKPTAKTIGIFKGKVLYLDGKPVSKRRDTSQIDLKELTEFASEAIKPIPQTKEVILEYGVYNTYHLLEGVAKESKQTHLNTEKSLLNSTCNE